MPTYRYESFISSWRMPSVMINCAFFLRIASAARTVRSQIQSSRIQCSGMCIESPIRRSFAWSPKLLPPTFLSGFSAHVFPVFAAHFSMLGQWYAPQSGLSQLGPVQPQSQLGAVPW